jgi:hypothetical protein
MYFNIILTYINNIYFNITYFNVFNPPGSLMNTTSTRADDLAHAAGHEPHLILLYSPLCNCPMYTLHKYE